MTFDQAQRIISDLDIISSQLMGIGFGIAIIVVAIFLHGTGRRD